MRRPISKTFGGFRVVQFFGKSTDGVNNTREYFSGTDYLNPNSYLRATMQSTGAVQLTFQAVSNRTYTVQYTDSLNPVAWSNLVIALPRTNTTTVTVIDPAPKPKRFHRLVTPAQR